MINSNKSIGSVYNVNAYIVINSTCSQQVTVTYLGIEIDKNRSFHCQAQNVMQKQRMLSRVGKNFSLYTKVLLYKSVIHGTSFEVLQHCFVQSSIISY